MSDLISRQSVLDRAITIPIAKILPQDKVIFRKAVFVDDIEKIPSAQQKGEWVTEDGYWYRCSVCNESCLQWGDESFALSNFCPNCGAKMRKTMTLKEAIKHCEKKAKGNSECAEDHAQLAEWLKELEERRREDDKRRSD